MGVVKRRKCWVYGFVSAAVAVLQLGFSATSSAQQPISKTIVTAIPSEVDWWQSQEKLRPLIQPIAYAPLVEISPDCGNHPCVALTFDDGPDPITTPQVIDTLNRYGARATFFVVGSRVQQSSGLLLQMHVGGHEIENHSWTHPDFRRLSPAQIREQIELTQQAVGNVGVSKPRFFRPPYEFRSDSVRRTVDMPFILWNVDPKDWSHKSPDKLAEEIIGSVRPGSIVVLHDTKEVTLRALPKVLDALHTQYRFVTVRDLLKLPDNARGEFASR